MPEVPSGWELHALDEGLTNKPAVNVLELYEMEGAGQINADQSDQSEDGTNACGE